ncbi:unnamed protein product [Musa textilis]
MVLWVFGYGSLIWNPGFDFDEKIIGFIKDYRRVFDLACIDHRGTPENPARTCTLEAKKGAICWGAAYCVKGGAEKEREAMKYLERRECEYDTKASVDFFKVKSLGLFPSHVFFIPVVCLSWICVTCTMQEGGPRQPTVAGVLVFVSTPDTEANGYYLGPAPLQDMARQIATARGPCGNNRDYLFRLEKALFDIGHEDDMVIELADEVRKALVLLQEKAAAPPVSPLPLMYLAPLTETAVVDSR